MLSKKLLDILACPKCKGELAYNRDTLVCSRCRLKYAVKRDIPDFINAKRF